MACISKQRHLRVRFGRLWTASSSLRLWLQLLLWLLMLFIAFFLRAEYTVTYYPAQAPHRRQCGSLCRSCTDQYNDHCTMFQPCCSDSSPHAKGRTMRSSCSVFTTGGALAAVPADVLCGRSDSGVSSLALSCVATGADGRGVLDSAEASVSVMPNARAGRRVAVRVPDAALAPITTCKAIQPVPSQLVQVLTSKFPTGFNKFWLTSEGACSGAWPAAGLLRRLLAGALDCEVLAVPLSDAPRRLLTGCRSPSEDCLRVASRALATLTVRSGCFSSPSSSGPSSITATLRLLGICAEALRSVRQLPAQQHTSRPLAAGERAK